MITARIPEENQKKKEMGTAAKSYGKRGSFGMEEEEKALDKKPERKIQNLLPTQNPQRG